MKGPSEAWAELWFLQPAGVWGQVTKLLLRNLGTAPEKDLWNHLIQSLLNAQLHTTSSALTIGSPTISSTFALVEGNSIYLSALWMAADPCGH